MEVGNLKTRREYDPKVVGKNLRRLRKKHGYSVEEIRIYLQYESVQSIYKIERGAGYPYADTLLAIMELYDAGVADLVDDPNTDDNEE